MLAALAAMFPTIASWINLVISYFQNKAQQQTNANTAEASAEADHQSDGAQSVADRESGAAQIAALEAADAAHDNPPTITVEVPK